MMNLSTKDEIVGKVHEAKGKIKVKVGQLTNHLSLGAEGVGDQIAGKVQRGNQSAAKSRRKALRPILLRAIKQR